MACIPLPDIELPTLPSPLTIDPPAVSVSFETGLCCKLLNLPPVGVAIDLPPGTLNPAIIVTLNENIAAVQAYLDSLPLDCPKE